GQRAFDARVRTVVEWTRATFVEAARLKGQRDPVLSPPTPTSGGWLDWGPWAIGGGLNARSTTFEVERARPHTAILPVAAMEAHGPHLPVGTDLLIVESVARRAAARLGPGVYLLPTIPFGNSTHARGTPGT